jgi:hypothetical protein
MPAWSDEAAQSFYRQKLFIIRWRPPAFTYFLNPPYSSLKYLIQFSLIDTADNRLHGFKKTGIRQPPESVRVFLSL